MSTLRNTLIVGLASDQFGNQLANSLQHMAGTTNALTVGATVVGGAATIGVVVGVTGGSLGFFGAAVTAKPTSVTLGNVTSLQTALVNLGLIATA